MRRKVYQMTDQQIADAAERWLSEKGLTWQALAREISPSLRGFTLKRRCVMRGYIKQTAKGFHRCYCCKKVKRVDKFYIDSSMHPKTSHRTCMMCVDEYVELSRKQQHDREKAVSKWDIDLSELCTKIWHEAHKR